ncbi:MAG: hypothetical protein ACKVS9_08655 [Phycisphaerae bacterium]
MRNGLIVFSLCILGSIGLSVMLFLTYKRETPATQDLITGLLYFMEQHDGRFPASEAEFRACSFVEPLPSGGVRIKPVTDSQFRRQTHGVEIADLKPFQIAWGADLAALSFNEYGKARDADNNPVALITFPTVRSSGKNYTFMLLAFREQILAKKQPESAPSSALSTEPA